VVRRGAAVVWLVLLTTRLALPCFAADEATANGAGVAISRGSDKLVTLTLSDLEQLQAVQVSPPFKSRGKAETFEGPLLWAVLTEAHALTFAKTGDQVRQAVTLTGSDGYTAVLGLGEISPDFEGKQVILADRVDGKPLGLDHLRVIVPGDGKAGRSVRDIVAIAVMPLPSTAH
jgi:hypothetical protein